MGQVQAAADLRKYLAGGGGDTDAEGVPAVLNPRTQRHIERDRNGTGHGYQNGPGLLCRISLAAAWGGDGDGLAGPAVARSGIDECCGQDFGAAQGVVTAVRGLLPSGGGIRCEQMSLAGTDVYYFHHSSW